MAESMEATDVSNPALNYGVVLDCGSSGSRVFVYYWPPHNGNPHTLLDIRQMKDRNRTPVVKKIKPGELVSGQVKGQRGEAAGGVLTEELAAFLLASDGGRGQVRSSVCPGRLGLRGSLSPEGRTTPRTSWVSRAALLVPQ